MCSLAPRNEHNPRTISPELLIALLELAYPSSDLTQSSHEGRNLFGLVCRAWHTAERASSAYCVCGIRRARLVAAELRRRRSAGRATTVLTLVYRARPLGAWEVPGENPAPGEAGKTLASALGECPALRKLVLWLLGKELGDSDTFGTHFVAACRNLGNLRGLQVDLSGGPEWTTSLARLLKSTRGLHSLEFQTRTRDGAYPPLLVPIESLPLRLRSLTMSDLTPDALPLFSALVSGSKSTLCSIIMLYKFVDAHFFADILQAIATVAERLTTLHLPTPKLDHSPTALLTFLPSLLSIRELTFSPAWVGPSGESLFDALATLPSLAVLDIQWRHVEARPKIGWDIEPLVAFVERSEGLRCLRVRGSSRMPLCDGLRLAAERRGVELQLPYFP